MQQNILVTQGVLTTVIALGYALIPDVSSAYWIFSVITTQVYLIMYLLMFVAAVRLRRNDPDHPRGYRAPMLVGLCGVGLRGLAGRAAHRVHPALAVRRRQRRAVYLLIVGGGALGLGLLVPFLFYRLRKPSWKQPRRGGGELSHERLRNRARAPQPLGLLGSLDHPGRLHRSSDCSPSARPTRARQANDKADQLIAALEDAGAQHVPTKDQIVRVLGADGGAICDDPNDALRQGDAATR